MANAVMNGSTNRIARFHEPEYVGGQEKCLGDFAQCIAKVAGGREDTPLWADRTDAVSVLRDQARSRLEKVYWGGATIKQKTVLGEGHGFVGGYTVPPDYSWGLMHTIEENAIWWKRAHVQRMASRTCELSLPDPTKTTGVSQQTNLLGGIVMTWGQPTHGSLTETEPVFRVVELVAQILQGVCYSTNQLVQDYLGLDDFLRRSFTRSVEWYTDQAFFFGNGAGSPGTAGSPLGIVNAPGTIKQGRQTPGTVTQQDVANMQEQLLPSSWARAIWCFSPTALQPLMNLAGGIPGILYFIPGDDGSIGMLYGRPLYTTEKLPDVGNTGDVCLLDPELYVVGHRDLLIDYSDQDPTSFVQNKSAWRIVWRGDGTPQLQSSLTLANRSNTKASPFVVLM